MNIDCPDQPAHLYLIKVLYIILYILQERKKNKQRSLPDWVSACRQVWVTSLTYGKKLYFFLLGRPHLVWMKFLTYISVCCNCSQIITIEFIDFPHVSPVSFKPPSKICSRWHSFFFYFSEKRFLDISCESSAKQTILLKFQNIFSLKNNEKKKQQQKKKKRIKSLECRLLQLHVTGTLRVNIGSIGR